MPGSTTIGAPIGPPVDTEAACVVDALEQLRAEHRVFGHYPDDTVARLLVLIDAGAEEVAAYERDRWARWFDHAARVGRDLHQQQRNGLHIAAVHLRANLARFTREGDPT